MTPAHRLRHRRRRVHRVQHGGQDGRGPRPGHGGLRPAGRGRPRQVAEHRQGADRRLRGPDDHVRVAGGALARGGAGDPHGRHRRRPPSRTRTRSSTQLRAQPRPVPVVRRPRQRRLGLLRRRRPPMARASRASTATTTSRPLTRLKPLNTYGWSKALFDLFARAPSRPRLRAAPVGGAEVLQRLRAQRGRISAP